MANYGPAVAPGGWLKMNDPAIRAGVLEVHEPGVMPGHVNQGALMRAVYGARTLVQDHFFFVGPIDMTRAKGELPASGDSASRGKNVIVTVFAIEFRSLDGWMTIGTVKHNSSFVEQPSAVLRHR